MQKLTTVACPGRRPARAVAVLALLGLGLACRRAPARLAAEELTTPVPAGALVPQMAALGEGRLGLSWLERRADQGYRLRASLGHVGAWGTPVTIDDNPDIAMFSADLPGLAMLPGGALLAYWERFDAQAGDPYATRIHLARSDDDGRTWQALPSPHGDGAVGQHSFVAPFAAREALGLVWLDAQRQRYLAPAQAGGRGAWQGAIGLRSALLGSDGRVRRDAFVDPITCECCPTSAALTSRGPVVAYRDRVTPNVRPEDVRDDAGSVRDVHVARLESAGWTTPRRVHADDWVIAGCPDNGPAVDALGARVAVAWWTGAGPQPHVSVAFSEDAGDTFGAPLLVSSGPAAGQVTVVSIDEGRAAIVGWLEGGQAWARRVPARGVAGAPLALGSAPLRARLPRWVSDGASILALFTRRSGDETSVQLMRLSAS